MNAVVALKDTEVALPRNYGLVPSSMGEAMKLADMMASAKLVPAALQKSAADCLMVIQQAVRWEMDPFAVAQECSVIQGKLMHSGKLVAAVVNARGNLTQRLSFDYRGAGDERTITVSGQLQGEPTPRTVEVTLKHAKTANRVWQTQPDQQLMYHGVRVWARRHTPELMLGVYSPEEFDEAAAAPGSRRPAPPAANVMLPPHDPQTGEVFEVADMQIIEPRSPHGAAETADASTSHSPEASAEPISDDTESPEPALSAPSPAEYEARWSTIIESATSAKQLATAWKAQAGLRRLIEWPDDNVLPRIKQKVTAAIAFLGKS